MIGHKSEVRSKKGGKVGEQRESRRGRGEGGRWGGRGRRGGGGGEGGGEEGGGEEGLVGWSSRKGGETAAAAAGLSWPLVSSSQQ